MADVVVRIPRSGGKAGTGKNKTSCIQVRKDGCIVKLFRFKVGDVRGNRRALSLAHAYAAGR